MMAVMLITPLGETCVTTPALAVQWPWVKQKLKTGETEPIEVSCGID
jgi:hypothetical protein